MYMRNWATGQILQVANDCPGMQAASSSYEQYLSLASQHLGHSTHQDSSELLCDRCLQPIDEATFQANVWRLEASPSASQQCTACIAQQHSMHSTAAQHACNSHGSHWAPLPLLACVWQLYNGHGAFMQLSKAFLHKHACMQAAIACHMRHQDKTTVLPEPHACECMHTIVVPHNTKCLL